jgi:hypothetical protein
MAIGVNPDPYTPSDSSTGTGTSGSAYENRRIGVNLLGQEPQQDFGFDPAKAARSVVGTAGDVLYNTIDVPNRFVQMEVAKARLKHAMAFGDARVSDKYINMISVDNMSIDQVAEEMYKDGVATTGGVAHDFLVSVFLDPMNLILPAVGKTYQTARRSSGLLDAMGPSTLRDITGRVQEARTLTPEESKFMGSRMNRVLGETYGAMSRKLSGAKKGFAQALFGVGASKIIQVLGLYHVKNIAEFADAAGHGQAFDRALSNGALHTMRGAAANHIAEQTISRNTQAVAARVEAVNKAASLEDPVARAEFLAASRLDETTAALTNDEIMQEFDALWKVKRDTPAGVDWAGRQITQRTGELAASELARMAGGDQKRLLNLLDETLVRQRKSTERHLDNIFARETADNMLIVDQGMPAVEAELARRLAGVVDESQIKDLIRVTLEQTVNTPKDQRKALIDLLNSAGMVHLGTASDALGSSLNSLRSLVQDTKFLETLDPKIRPIISNQLGRLSIIGARTMTDLDRRTILKALEATDSPEQKIAIVSDAIAKFDNMGGEFQALHGITTVDAGTVEAFTKTLNELSDLPKQVPVEWTKALDGVGAYKTIVSEAKRLGYKLILEPEGVVSKPGWRAIDRGTRTAVKPRVSLWVPITGDGMDVMFGTRNRVGQVIDFATKNRSTIKIMQNTLDRMYEYASHEKIGSSITRNVLRDLHATMMDYAFASKGSLRTVALSLSGEGDAAVNGILDVVRNKVKLRGEDYLQEFDRMVHQGDLQSMMFYSAMGDLEHVGTAQYASGFLKNWMLSKGGFRGKMGEAITNWTDFWYPKLKFSGNPLFWGMEIVESKFFNALRGIYPEWQLGKGINAQRFGFKRFYDVVDPNTGKTLRLDSVKLISENAIANRPELKFAQEMATINQYFNYKTTEKLLNSGDMGEEVVAAINKQRGLFSARFFESGAGKTGRMKAADFWRLTTEQNLNSLAEKLPALMSEHAPAQWNLWMEAAGGDARGASLLYLNQISELRSSRSAVLGYLDKNRPIGLGFGRQFDDDPIKNLRTAVKEARSAVKSSSPSKAATQLADRLVDVRSGAQAVGYSEETIAALDKAIELARSVPPGVQASRKIFNDIDQAVGIIGDSLVKEFETAVARKNFVKEALMADGIPQNVATEMSKLFVVAARRGEINPELILAIEKSFGGGTKLAKEQVVALADNLQAIREVRTGEETVINTVMDGIENQIRHESQLVHFYNTERSFAERSLNHVVFALYPTSYMFSKVLPEYMRLLFATRTKSIAGLVLNPYDMILKFASGGKFSLKSWTDFAPLVGFNAAYKTRQMLINEMSQVQDPSQYNPLMFFLTNTLIPGLPTDITVSASPIATTAVEAGMKQADQGGSAMDIGGAVAKAGLYQATAVGQRAVGVVQLGKTASSIIGQTGKAVSEAGGPVEFIQGIVSDTLDSIGKVVFNK